MSKLLITRTELSASTEQMLKDKGISYTPVRRFDAQGIYDEVILDRDSIIYKATLSDAIRSVTEAGRVSLVTLAEYLKQELGVDPDREPEIAYRIRNDHDVPEIYINGEQAHVASCSYQYVTRDGKQPGINCFIASICLKSEDEGKREPIMHTVSVDQRINQVFYQ